LISFLFYLSERNTMTGVAGGKGQPNFGFFKTERNRGLALAGEIRIWDDMQFMFRKLSHAPYWED
jgi:hypothetical protein